jgi:hypothetical protein
MTATETLYTPSEPPESVLIPREVLFRTLTAEQVEGLLILENDPTKPLAKVHAGSLGKILSPKQISLLEVVVTEPKPEGIETRADFEKMPAKARSEFVKAGGLVVD